MDIWGVVAMFVEWKEPFRPNPVLPLIKRRWAQDFPTKLKTMPYCPVNNTLTLSDCRPKSGTRCSETKKRPRKVCFSES